MTGTLWTRLFFLGFYLIMVPFTMNVLISFIIEAFLLQLEYHASPMQDRLQLKARIECERNPMLREEFGLLEVGKGTVGMEVFLQRMFGAEALHEMEAEEKLLATCSQYQEPKTAILLTSVPAGDGAGSHFGPRFEQSTCGHSS